MKSYIKKEIVGNEIISFKVDRDINKFTKRDNKRDLFACLSILCMFIPLILVI